MIAATQYSENQCPNCPLLLPPAARPRHLEGARPTPRRMAGAVANRRGRGVPRGAVMSIELPNRPDEPANRPPAQAFSPPAPTEQQAEAVDWAPPPGPSAPTEQIPSYDGAPPAKPPLDTVSLFALITAAPGLGL